MRKSALMRIADYNLYQRLYFLDNIKVFLTILVIVHHVGQAYGPTGGFWEYQSSLGESISILGRFFGVNSAFFMGFFFLISGYFITLSYDKSNGEHFLQKRFVRLGIPLMFVFFIMKPLQMYFHHSLYSGNAPITLFRYYTDIWFGFYGMPEGFIVTDVFPAMNFGHAWFIEHLLLYSIIYWCLRKILKNPLIKQEDKPFSALNMIIIALIIAVLSVIVRIWYPIDDWRGVLGFFQVEVAHWPQYLTLFIVGIIAYRKNWLTALKTRTGYIALAIGIVMAAAVYIGAPVWDIWPFYESFFAIALICGLITLFREKYNLTTPLLKTLSRSSYAAYIFHFPIVLSVQYLLDRVVIGGAVGKFITVSIISVVVTYLVSILIIRVKPLRKIFT